MSKFGPVKLPWGPRRGHRLKFSPPYPLCLRQKKLYLDKTNALKWSKSCHCLSLAKHSMIIHKLCIVIKLFSAPEAKAQVHFCDHASSVRPSVVRPSSVRRPSVRRPSVVVNFSHFRLLLWNCWTEFIKTWQEARSQCPLQSLCFLARSEKQDGRHGLWLAETFSTSPLKLLNRIQRHLTGSKISMSATKFVFFGPIGKTRWSPWLLIGWDIFHFSSETANQNSTKLDSKKDFNVLYQVCVFGPIRQTRWPPWPLIGWDIFDFSSETAERNLMKRDRNQDLTILCFWGRSEK